MATKVLALLLLGFLENHKTRTMAPQYDYASSFLFCVEDNSCLLGFDDGSEDEKEGHTGGCVSEPKRSDFDGDLLMDFPLQSDEFLDLLVAKEYEYMPKGDYIERLRSGALDSSIRRDAIEWILKVHAHCNFGPLSAYLSVNYLDRFLSNYELPKGKAWMTQLLSVACLSLAAKMEETEVPLYLDLQVCEAKYVFEARTIQRMELLVLSTLKWRMQAVTPFSFIDFFLHKFSGGNAPAKVAISRSMELILSTTKGIDFLAFKPFEIAAAITLLVLGETHSVDVEKIVSCCIQVTKEEVLRCYGLIKEMKLMRNSRPHEHDNIPVSSVPRSPISVLDAAYLSYKSGDTTVESHAECHHCSPLSKRRKINKS
ncbi:cyclin-D4-1-like [Canna indica]|uniref:Cyclin-D4-1-like n=1 Tax=Canna indica TaxID=4628 RepID=A0AAQ3Q0C4_9LILI|nr:cyclin-D4-1-like [Canna indica]